MVWPLGGGKEGWLEQDEGCLLNLITGQHSGNLQKASVGLVFRNDKNTPHKS